MFFCVATNGTVGSPTLSAEEIAAIRHKEARKAADIVGAELIWPDSGGYRRDAPWPKPSGLPTLGDVCSRSIGFPGAWTSNQVFGGFSPRMTIHISGEVKTSR